MTAGQWSRRGLLAQHRRPLAPTLKSETKDGCIKNALPRQFDRAWHGSRRIWLASSALDSRSYHRSVSPVLFDKWIIGSESCCHRTRISLNNFLRPGYVAVWLGFGFGTWSPKAERTEECSLELCRLGGT